MDTPTSPLPGTSDLFADECTAWRLLEECAHRVFPLYGYGELRVPIFERTEVFLHSIGNETDIVQKEMYTFEDRGGRSLTLRPEGTAGVMRALANQGFSQGEEKRVYYLGPMFRGERPAAGRKRQFHQIGTECVGKTAPAIDVETIAMLMHFLQSVGIPAERTRLLLNSRGVQADREPIARALHQHFSAAIGDMCEDCQRRLGTNVWRILDCKIEGCQGYIEAAPSTTELLSAESRDYFRAVCEGLDSLGICYEVDPRMVRGLDYYAHTVFEVVFEGIGAQNSIAGGGRYIIQPPGTSAPVEGVGFAAGMERLLLTREELGQQPPANRLIDVYLVSLGEAARRHNLRLAGALRQRGVSVLMDLEGRGMRAQMRTANKLNSPWILILGDTELEQGMITCKNMVTSDQQELALDEAVTTLVSRLGLA